MLVELRDCTTEAHGDVNISGTNTGTITWGSNLNCKSGSRQLLQNLVVFTGAHTNLEVPPTSFAIPMTLERSLPILPLQNLATACPAGQQFDAEAGQCAIVITNTGTMTIS